MGGLFGSNRNRGAERRVAEQEKQAEVREANQAKEIAARRRAGSSENQSKTLFSQVLGTDESLGMQTKLGG